MIHWIKNLFYSTFFLVVVLIITTQGAITSGYPWHWDDAIPYFLQFSPSGAWEGFGPLLSKGLVTTLRISSIALVGTILLGLAIAILRLIGGRLTTSLCLCYINLFRNTPLMVQLIILYLLIPASWNISAEWVAIVTLTLFEGAYMAEIFRAGILSIPRQQWEAAVSLGLPYSLCWKDIILPQAMRSSLPACLNQSVSLIKDSSLASVIAVSELSQQSSLAISDSFLPFEIWLPVAGVYLVLALILTTIAKYISYRLSLGAA